MSPKTAVALMTPEEMAAICEERTEEGNLAIAQITYDEMHELSVGRVPARIQKCAKAMIDWTFADLRKNAAKPVRKVRQR